VIDSLTVDGRAVTFDTGPVRAAVPAIAKFIVCEMDGRWCAV